MLAMSSSLYFRADVFLRPPQDYANGDGKFIAGPEQRLGLFQPAAEPHRANAAGEPGGIVGFDSDRAQRRRAHCRLEFGGGNLAQEAAERLVLDHADDGIVIAGHADVGDEGGATRQNLVIGSRRMGVGADNKARAPIDEMSHRLLLARGLGVQVDDDRVGAGFERAGGNLALDRCERVVERVHEDAAHGVDHEHARAVLRLDSAAPRPGVPAGKLIGRISRGARSMNTSASRWSQAWLPSVTASAPQSTKS